MCWFYLFFKKPCFWMTPWVHIKLFGRVFGGRFELNAIPQSKLLDFVLRMDAMVMTSTLTYEDL